MAGVFFLYLAQSVFLYKNALKMLVCASIVHNSNLAEFAWKHCKD